MSAPDRADTEAVICIEEGGICENASSGDVKIDLEFKKFEIFSKKNFSANDSDPSSGSTFLSLNWDHFLLCFSGSFERKLFEQPTAYNRV